MYDYPAIAAKFQPEGKFHSCEPYGSGHIHETFLLIKHAGKNITKFILQRFNNSVFKEPEKVLNNIRKLTDHLKKNSGSPGALFLSMVPTMDNKYWYKDESDNYWRCFDFIEGSYTVDRVEKNSQANEAARFFANFITSLSDFKPEDLDITIPDFRDIQKRLKWLDEAILKGNRARGIAAAQEIKHVKLYSDMVGDYLNILHDLPVRVTHNDTKINNVLFSTSTGKGLCVIDLDTVMPGTVLSDFGDMVRSFTNSADEDEPDLRKVFFDLGIFKELTIGFLEGSGSILIPVEKNNLILGGKIIIYMQAIRFLTDYLSEDTYYKIDYPDHNLVRTRNQLKLLDSFIDHENAAGTFIRSL
jgi:thiamine kinase-like enzyme